MENTNQKEQTDAEKKEIQRKQEVSRLEHRGDRWRGIAIGLLSGFIGHAYAVLTSDKPTMTEILNNSTVNVSYQDINKDGIQDRVLQAKYSRSDSLYQVQFGMQYGDSIVYSTKDQMKSQAKEHLDSLEQSIDAKYK